MATLEQMISTAYYNGMFDGECDAWREAIEALEYFEQQLTEADDRIAPRDLVSDSVEYLKNAR